LLQIFRDMPGEKNVSRITAIHHPLRDIDASTGYVCLPGHVHNSANRTAVHPIRSLNSGCSFIARLISNAHSTGASGVL